MVDCVAGWLAHECACVCVLYAQASFPILLRISVVVFVVISPLPLLFVSLKPNGKKYQFD